MLVGGFRFRFCIFPLSLNAEDSDVRVVNYRKFHSEPCQTIAKAHNPGFLSRRGGGGKWVAQNIGAWGSHVYFVPKGMLISQKLHLHLHLHLHYHHHHHHCHLDDSGHHHEWWSGDDGNDDDGDSKDDDGVTNKRWSQWRRFAFLDTENIIRSNTYLHARIFADTQVPANGVVAYLFNATRTTRINLDSWNVSHIYIYIYIYHHCSTLLGTAT